MTSFQLDERVRIGDRLGEIVATVPTATGETPLFVVRFGDGETRIALAVEMTPAESSRWSDESYVYVHGRGRVPTAVLRREAEARDRAAAEIAEGLYVAYDDPADPFSAKSPGADAARDDDTFAFVLNGIPAAEPERLPQTEGVEWFVSGSGGHVCEIDILATSPDRIADFLRLHWGDDEEWLAATVERIGQIPTAADEQAREEAAYEIASSDHVVGLSNDEWTFVLDLLSHDSELLGDLLGYGDDDGPGGEFVERLIVSTRAAFGVETTEPQNPYSESEAAFLTLAESEWWRQMQGEIRVDPETFDPEDRGSSHDFRTARLVLSLATQVRDTARMVEGEAPSDPEVARRVVSGLVAAMYPETE